MAGNVMSWDAAIKRGYEPRLYPFSSDQIPSGDYDAVLDFKIWAKKIMGISCYFTQTKTGEKFQLTVYCTRKKGVYKIDDCEIDFVQCPIEQVYEISVCANEKKKVLFKKARLITGISNLV
jgi:hypothetical protein